MQDKGERTMRDHAVRKGVKGILLVGHIKGPRGFGLRAGDPCGVRANGSGSETPAQPSTDD